MNVKRLLAAVGLLQLPLLGIVSARDNAAERTWETPRLMMSVKFEHNQLQWHNGETLTGDLEGFSDGRLLWKTSLFSDPLRLARDVIQRIDFKADFFESDANFRLTLIDGSHVYGELDAITEDAITFISTHAGTLQVQRDHLVSIERTKVSGNRGGPHVLRYKTIDDDNRKRLAAQASEWMFAAAGFIGSPAFNNGFHLQGKLPDKGLIEFKYRTDRSPAFSIETSGTGTLALETWGDELVFTYGKTFVSIGNYFGEQERVVDLRICWDHQTGHAAVYDVAGKCLARLDLPTARPETSEDPFKQQLLAELEIASEGTVVDIAPKSLTGLKIRNKGLGMMVERFQVSAWSGEPPSALPEDEPYADTDIGVIRGELTRHEGGNLVFRRANGKTSRIPLGLVNALRWPRSPQLEAAAGITDVWYADGQLIRGKLLDGPNLQLASSATNTPITAVTENLRALVFGGQGAPNENLPLDELDALVSTDSVLHGTLEFHGNTLPRFFPVGSEEAVKLSKAGDWSVTRAFPQDDTPEGDITRALLHFGKNETVPVTVTSIHRDHVEFRWDALEKQTLPTEFVHAVHYGTTGARDCSFAGPSWRLRGDARSKLKREGNGLTLSPGDSIGNAYALQGNDVSFRMGRDSGLASIRVRLFAQGDKRQAHEIAFLLGDYGGNIYCGVERDNTPGQIDSNHNVPTNNEPSLVRFVISDKQVELFVNEVACGAAPVPSKAGGGSRMGMIIETASLWGNQVGAVKLLDFANQGSTFAAGLAPFSDDAKQEALLLPRLRRDSPPHHVLVGRNGDLLRGTVEAITSSHLAFRTGLETFKVPQERVSAVVWVRPQKEASDDDTESSSKSKEPETETDSRQWLDLANGGRLGLVVEAWEKDVIIGTHPHFGKCRIPTSLVYQLRLREPQQSSTHAALANWRLENTVDPVLPDDDGLSSPLVGREAADFTLPMLDDSEFKLKDVQGKVVVLDFWATWCGPCVKSLPSLIETMATFPEEDVAFLAIDQGESKAQVEQFLKARKFTLPVALDGDQKVGRDYGVEGIPNTVIIGRDGKVCFVKTGFSADGAQQVDIAVREALAQGAADS